MLHALMGLALPAAFAWLAASFGFGAADLQQHLPFGGSDWASLASPATFRWVYGSTPCSGLGFVALSLGAYLGGCLLLQRLMRDREPLATGPDGSPTFTALVVAHNAATSLGSFAMLCGILRELHRATAHYDSPWALLCDEREIMLDVSKEGSQLGYWAYLYYLSKFYEMLDTVILALKKRPLEFLQM